MKLLFFLLLPFCALAQQRIYVNAAATGNNSGTRWADAHPDLHAALQKAVKGDTIWVAAGTYRPDTALNRRRSFVQPSGVVLLGGFGGTETQAQQRNRVQHPTILSGDLGKPGDSTDNAYTILYMENPDSSTVLDGFILERGNADYKGSEVIFRAPEKSGGALYIMARDGWAYPEIRNCVFQYNYAYVHGGAVYINGTGLGSVAPRFAHCTFQYNQARVNGGAMYKEGGSWAERGADLLSCRFLNNTAGLNGGGYYMVDTERADRQDLIYCTFTGNRAISRAGGGCNFDLGRTDGSGGVRMFGCTYANNQNSWGESYYVDNTRALPVRYFEMDSCFLTGRDTLYPLLTTGGIYKSTCIIKRCLFKLTVGMYLTDADTMVIDQCTVLPASISSSRGIGMSTSYYTIFKNNYFAKSKNGIGCFPKMSVFNNIIVSTFDAPLESNFLELYNNLIISKQVYSAPSPSMSFPIRNCILIDTDRGSFLPYNAILENCLVSMECGQFSNPSCGPTNLVEVNPLFRDSAHADFRLLPCSPLINAGTNSVLSLFSTDIAGNARFMGGQVDIGPYEVGPYTPAPGIQAACAGFTNGRIAFGTTAGCPPYTYRWRSDSGAEGSDTTGLAPGRYVFTITDARGQTAFDTLTVPESPRPTPKLSVEDQLCGTALGGSLQATVPAAVPLPLRYRWSDQPAANTPLRSDLPPGRYGLTVTDALGCQDSAAATLARVGTLAFVAGGTPISCFGRADGTVWVAPSNGKPPFNYYWSTGQTDSLIPQITPGTYIATVTDDVGCTATFPFYITQPDSLHFVAEVQDATDTLTANGHIRITGVSGGTQPYGYRWSTGGMDTEIGGLRPGTYTATVTDQSGCTSVRGFSVRFLVSTGTALQAQRPALVIWPNPTPGPTHIAGMAGNRTPPPQRLRLWDAQGRLVLETAVSEAADGRWQCSVDLRGLPAGVYVAEAENGARGKVVLE